MPAGKMYKSKKPKASSKAKANKALKEVKQLKKLVNKTIENKQVNYSITATSISSSGYATRNFISLAAGAEDGNNYGDSARVGNSITLMSQQFGFNIVGSSTDTFNQVRILLVESTEGSQDISISDVLRYGNYSTFGDNVFSSPYTTKSDTNKRYKVHMDKCFVLSGLATKGGCPPCKVIKHTIRYGKNGKVVSYPSASASLPTNHKVNLLIITDSVSATHPTMSYNVRSTYKDA